MDVDEVGVCINLPHSPSPSQLHPPLHTPKTHTHTEHAESKTTVIIINKQRERESAQQNKLNISQRLKLECEMAKEFM